MGTIMAKITITNKKKEKRNSKGFSCFVSKLCTNVPLYPNTSYPDIRYHNGNQEYPQVGDTVYISTGPGPQDYALFNNNSAALPEYAFNNNLVYFITNNNGVVTELHTC